MSSTPLKLTGDFGIVEESVRRRIADFANLGFELTDVRLAGSPALQVFPMFHFANNKSEMSLDLSFFPARPRQTGGFTILIVRPGNRKLSVKEYLRAHGESELAEVFNYREPANIREFSESALAKLIEVMAKDLRPILEGKLWEETPIDWMGYK